MANHVHRDAYAVRDYVQRKRVVVTWCSVLTTQSCDVHSHIHWALDTYRCFLCDRLGPYAHLPPLMCTSKSTLDLEVNHAVACVRIA